MSIRARQYFYSYLRALVRTKLERKQIFKSCLFVFIMRYISLNLPPEEVKQFLVDNGFLPYNEEEILFEKGIRFINYKQVRVIYKGEGANKVVRIVIFKFSGKELEQIAEKFKTFIKTLESRVV